MIVKHNVVRVHLMTSIRSLFKKLKIALLTVAAVVGFTHIAPQAAVAPIDEEISIEKRIADIRHRFQTLQQLDSEIARKFKEKSRLSQWFNFPNWPNWRDWRNWNNQRWLNW